MNWWMFSFFNTTLNHHLRQQEKTSNRQYSDCFFWLDLFIPDKVVKYTFSKRGKRQLTHKGYKFTKNDKRGNRIRWRCIAVAINGRYGCKATASTYEKNGIERVSFSGNHDHPPNGKIYNWIWYWKNSLKTKTVKLKCIHKNLHRKMQKAIECFGI